MSKLRHGSYSWLANAALLMSTHLAYSADVEINLLYVHGVKSSAASRANAENSLTDLRSAVDADVQRQIDSYRLAHPEVTVRVNSAAANLYTARHSGRNPSDSTDPTSMDDWEVGDPGCTTQRQGDPCTTAFEWRFRLASEIDRLYPGKHNLVLIGHSTGARVAMEVASNTSASGVNTYDWGVAQRIAAVVTINGMIDGLQSNRYNVAGAASFVTTCKNGDVISLFGDASPPGNGWCEYAGNVSGVAAADWVARNERSLVLISSGSCSPSLWTGHNDGSLPFAAQGSPFSAGLSMTPTAGQRYGVAYGRTYGGPFCHSSITSGGDPQHSAAVNGARARIYEFLFSSAPRVAAQGTHVTSPVPYRDSSATFHVGSVCPSGETSGGLQVVGSCRHPGRFDGDDHPINSAEFTIANAACAASYRWTQNHDPNNPHAGEFFWQARSQLGPGGLVTVLQPQ
jgi:pimeloyl-ACP methyl ester carboxylesterase